MPSLEVSMAQEEEESSLEAKFAAAVKVIWSLPEEGPFQPSDDMLLRFYGYYMQATQGPCSIPRPSSFWDSGGKVKWDAWSSLGNMTKVEAMKNYIQDIQLRNSNVKVKTKYPTTLVLDCCWNLVKILETIPISDEVSDLVQKLDSFFMEVDNDDDAENEMNGRSLTRPFAQCADEQENQVHKPMMEGYGDLWDDIQDVQEDDKEGSVCGASVSSEEAEGTREASELGRKEDCSDWKSEEEELGDEEDNTEDKDEDCKVWTPDQRLLMVEDLRWRADTRGSSSSVEASGSSLTNGTHSSLNTEMEEDELAYSIEHSMQSNTYMHFNGHTCENIDTIPHKNQRSTDSDNEEFCDSMEHLAVEEGMTTSKMLSPGSGADSVRQKDLWFDRTAGEKQAIMADSVFIDGINARQLHSTLSTRGGASQSWRATCSPGQSASADAPCWVSQSGRAAGANVNEQIAAALLRLQRDMSNVVHRLHTLEARTSSQSRSSLRPENSLPVEKKFPRPSWWPFDFCPLTVVLYALWPLITHWGVQVYLKHKRRKIS